jgi:hypothetical protein
MNWLAHRTPPAAASGLGRDARIFPSDCPAALAAGLSFKQQSLPIIRVSPDPGAICAVQDGVGRGGDERL